jgi:penicillin-binding protein 1A
MERIAALARAMGVDQSRLDAVPSLALGTSPVTLFEMAAGYATIARGGRYQRPVTIRRIVDRRGEVLAEFGTETRQAMSADAAADLIDMMRGVVSRGTGTLVKSRFGLAGDVAGKTGTTQNNTDGWFILMHPNLVAGAWVGFNDSRIAVRSDYWGQGGHNAVLLVGDFFKAVQKAKWIGTNERFPPPRHPAAPPPASVPEEGSYAMPREANSPDPIDSPRPEAIVRRHDEAPPKSADEIERALKEMDRRRQGIRGEAWSPP